MPPSKPDPTPDQLARWQANRRRAERQLTQPPVILGGCGRSGTTLLLSIMSAHPRVLAIPIETNQLCPGGYAENPNVEATLELGPDFYRHFDAVTPGSTYDRWCEKTPRNILFFDRIIEFFQGRVRFVQIIRDGRDVVTSRHPVNPGRYWVAVDRWVRDVSAGLAFLDHPLVHTIRYEQLIRDNPRVVQGICAFLDLPYTPEMVDWHKHAKVRENSALGGEVKPLFESSIGKWKKPEHAQRVDELLANPEARHLLRELGYLE